MSALLLRLRVPTRPRAPCLARAHDRRPAGTRADGPVAADLPDLGVGYFKDGSTCDFSQATPTANLGAPFFNASICETPRANFPLRQLQAPAMANRSQTNAPVADPMAATAAPPVSRKSAKGWAELKEGEASPVPRDQVPGFANERAIKQAAAERKKQQAIKKQRRGVADVPTVEEDHVEALAMSAC